MTYEQYARERLEKLMNYQNDFRERYEIDRYSHWFYNQSSEVLELSLEGKSVYFKYIPVGTFSQTEHTWKWAWANEYSLEPGKLKTLEVEDFGKKKNFQNLTNPHFEGDEYTGWEMTAIAFDLLGGMGTYRVVFENLEKYFLLTGELSKDEVELIESSLIDCGVHGKIRPAFICQHLSKDRKTGFEEAFETYRGMELDEDDDLQAWCSECEIERLRTDGWNDESMAFAKIELVCERCYFEIKDFNLS